jgi:polyhydroxyalkanoate synthesis regulator phasin
LRLYIPADIIPACRKGRLGDALGRSEMDAVRKLAVLGLGLLDITEEKARELADELVKRGEARSEQPGKLVKDIMARGEEVKKTIQRHVEGTVEKALAKANLASARDLAALEKRVAELEKKLG